MAKQAIAALNATSSMFPELAEVRIGKQLNKIVRDVADALFPAVVVMVARTSGGWGLLEDTGRTKFKEYVEKAPESEIVKVLGQLAKIEDLHPTIVGRIGQLDRKSLAELVGNKHVAPLAKGAVLEAVYGATNWDRVNVVITELLIPIFDLVSKGEIEEIIRSPSTHGTDLPGAHAYESLIEKVRLSKMFEDHELAKLLDENGAGYISRGW